MSWSDLSPAIRTFVIVGAVLLAVMLAFRSCVVGGDDEPPPPRGPVK